MRLSCTVFEDSRTYAHRKNAHRTIAHWTNAHTTSKNRKKCSQDLILAREICQYGHRRYLTNYFYSTMHYSRPPTKHGLAIAVLYCWRYVECSLSWVYTHRLRLGAGQVEHDSDNYFQVVVDAGAITSHFCSPLISPTMSLSWSRATVLRRLWSSHRRCQRKYESCLRIRPRLRTSCVRLRFCRTFC